MNSGTSTSQISKINIQIKKQSIGTENIIHHPCVGNTGTYTVNAQKTDLEGCPTYQLQQLTSGRGMRWGSRERVKASVQFSSLRSLNRVWLFETPWIAAGHPLLLLPPIPPSIRVFSNESTLHMRWPKYWSFSFNISPPNEHPGLISLQSKGLSRVHTTVQKHQFFGTQLSSQSNSHIHTWPLEKP